MDRAGASLSARLFLLFESSRIRAMLAAADAHAG
jgi:hypothetical protein